MNPRRLTSLLVIWFALFSIAAPAISCAAAAAAAHGSCCPSEGVPPCGECPEPAGAAPSTTHCITAATAAVAPAIALESTVKVAAQPDLDMPALPPSAPASLRHGWPAPGSQPDWHRSAAAAHAYLLTGRLRL